MLDGVEWVLFDAVGTLIYPQPGVAEVYWAAGKRFGSRLGVEEIGERFKAAMRQRSLATFDDAPNPHPSPLPGGEGTVARGGTSSEALERERWRKIVASVFEDVGDGAEELFEALWRHFAEPASWRAYDDVAVLAELKGRGLRIGIASNFDGRLEGIVRSMSVLADCEAVFVSSSVGFSKPDEGFFREIEKRIGVEAGKIALVGDDGVNDVEGAKGAGWRAVGLERDSRVASQGVIRSLWELFWANL